MEFKVNKTDKGYYITVDGSSSMHMICQIIKEKRPDLLKDKLCREYYGWVNTYPSSNLSLQRVYFDEEYYAQCAIDDCLEPLSIMNALLNEN
jgi:hypothetical protein